MYTVVSTDRPACSPIAPTPAEPSTALRRPAVDDLDTYARAAAGLARLKIDEAWWAGVLRHLTVLCDNAALVEAVEIAPSGREPGSPAAGQTAQS